jgi:hypothetical protein
LNDLWRLQRAIDQWYIDWCNQLTDAAIDEKVKFTLIGAKRRHDVRAAKS